MLISSCQFEKIFIYVLSYFFLFNLETLSEAVKMLKAEYAVTAIQKHKIDRAIIFCRTKLDCDNLEQYFKQIGKRILYYLLPQLFFLPYLIFLQLKIVYYF